MGRAGSSRRGTQRSSQKTRIGENHALGAQGTIRGEWLLTIRVKLKLKTVQVDAIVRLGTHPRVDVVRDQQQHDHETTRDDRLNKRDDLWGAELDHNEQPHIRNH